MKPLKIRFVMGCPVGVAPMVAATGCAAAVPERTTAALILADNHALSISNSYTLMLMGGTCTVSASAF